MENHKYRWKVGDKVHFTTDDTYETPFSGPVEITEYQGSRPDNIYPYVVKGSNGIRYGAGDRHLRGLTKLEKALL